MLGAALAGGNAAPGTVRHSRGGAGNPLQRVPRCGQVGVTTSSSLEAVTYTSRNAICQPACCRAGDRQRQAPHRPGRRRASDCAGRCRDLGGSAARQLRQFPGRLRHGYLAEHHWRCPDPSVRFRGTSPVQARVREHRQDLDADPAAVPPGWSRSGANGVEAGRLVSRPAARRRRSTSCPRCGKHRRSGRPGQARRRRRSPGRPRRHVARDQTSRP